MPTLIPAASRTMAVFEAFAREKKELSNSDMARLLSLPDSSTSDLLYTLHSLGYLMRTSRSRRFYPTGRLFEAARQISENDPLSTVAREAVEQLAEKTNETAFFGVFEHHSAKVMASQSSRQPLRYIIEVGERVALHASAMGKALLGALPREEMLARIAELKLTQVTPDTITDPQRLVAEIDAGRERGWYEAHGEGAEGVGALATAAIVGEQSVGISLAGPFERFSRHRDTYLAALHEVKVSLLSH